MSHFTTADEIKLIGIVAKHPNLYDTSHAEYRNTFEKENTWKTIGESLSRSSEDCKKQWRLIRDGYQRFKKKSKSGLGSVAPRNAKDKRHKLLWFLEDHKSGGPNVPDSPAQSHEVTLLDPIKIEYNPEYEEEDAEEMSEVSELHDNNYDQEIIPEQILKIKHTKRVSNDEIPLKLWKERDSKKQILKKAIKNQEDDVELFCRHIGAVLRSLPPVYKAEAKKHIGVLISDYEIKAAQINGDEDSIDMNTPSPHSSYSREQS